MPRVLSAAIYVSLKKFCIFFLYMARFVQEIGISESVFVTNVAVKGLLLPFFK